jgi:CDP-glucose 4,6-dehydratase
MAGQQSSMEDMVAPSAAFWRDKRVLVTGHTGFKGAWLTLALHRLGARVAGLALEPVTSPNLFRAAGMSTISDSRIVDIRDPVATAEAIANLKPDIVLHLAAQALVREGYRKPLDTFATNVMGTGNVLDALRGGSTRVAVIITTDKVYRNNEWVWPYREVDVLGGHDPYSASKAAAELVVECYRDAFLATENIAVASARAGNVMGGGDWSADRLIPDAVRAWQAGEVLPVRRPSARRPWQHVIEPITGYLLLAQRLWADPALAGAWNFGPDPNDAAEVRRVVITAQDAFGFGKVEWGDGSDGPHEAGWLALDTAKARQQLGLHPRWTLDESVGRTMNWYAAFLAGGDARKLCEADLEAYGAVG